MTNKLNPRYLFDDGDTVIHGCWNVVIIDSAGKRQNVYQFSYGSSLAYALLIMMPDVDVIAIQKNGVDIQRFDREPCRDTNNWCEVEDLEKPIAQSVRTNLLA